MVMRLLILALALAGTWLAWSGMFKGLLLGLGLLSVLISLWLALRMRLLRRELFALDLVPRMLFFWAALLVDIIKSNLVVARIVLSPGLPISPIVVKLEPELEGRVGQATLANSITLTPSTVTVDAHEGVFLVHCLTEQSARETLESDLPERLRRTVRDR